jgi:hypothetical protein
MDGVASVRSAARRSAERGGFFAGASAEGAFYSIDAVAFGGGLHFGYGFDIGAVGVGVQYLVDTEGLTSYVPNLFVRFYLPLSGVLALPKLRSQDAPSGRLESGPFLQFSLGPSFHAWNPRIPADDLAGTVSAGLSAGWRFLVGDRWYVEPALRAGHPFLAGIGIAAGCRL